MPEIISDSEGESKNRPDCVWNVIVHALKFPKIDTVTMHGMHNIDINCRCSTAC